MAIGCMGIVGSVQAATDSTSAPSLVPFAGMDLTWINGQNRQKDFPLTVEGVGTGVVYLDAHYNGNFASPLDNTQTNSAVAGRTNEFSLALASIGFEANYKNAIARLWLQTGSMLHVIQETDGSVGHGRNTGTDNLKLVREAAAGYHFDAWHGINVEMGIFMSYIGLESYITQENWSYQRSLVCDFTPFYFQGARIQAFPSNNYKVELWLLNGWQTYNSWNRTLGVGNSNYWRPTENLQLVANFYYGKDARGLDRTRFHHDNSVVARLVNAPDAPVLSQLALSVNTHYGFQQGAGVTAASEYMAGSSVATRLWFARNLLALTLRADAITNPGLYLAFTPSPVSPNDFTDATATGAKLNIAQFTLTFDVMPSDHVTLRLEYLHRAASVPYFAGPGGTTSPDGWVDTPTTGWRPDLRTWEDRMILAMNVRL